MAVKQELSTKVHVKCEPLEVISDQRSLYQKQMQMVIEKNDQEKLEVKMRFSFSHNIFCIFSS